METEKPEVIGVSVGAIVIIYFIGRVIEWAVR